MDLLVKVVNSDQAAGRIPAANGEFVELSFVPMTATPAAAAVLTARATPHVVKAGQRAVKGCFRNCGRTQRR
ncbi:MAG: hypothetical protein Q4C81_09300 [Kocuria sp.]|nr:hypothetical protein [Kocuria sp.]